MVIGRSATATPSPSLWVGFGRRLLFQIGERNLLMGSSELMHPMAIHRIGHMPVPPAYLWQRFGAWSMRGKGHTLSDRSIHRSPSLAWPCFFCRRELFSFTPNLHYTYMQAYVLTYSYHTSSMLPHIHTIIFLFSWCGGKGLCVCEVT